MMSLGRLVMGASSEPCSQYDTQKISMTNGSERFCPRRLRHDRTLPFSIYSVMVVCLLLTVLVEELRSTEAFAFPSESLSMSLPSCTWIESSRRSGLSSLKKNPACRRHSGSYWATNDVGGCDYDEGGASIDNDDSFLRSLSKTSTLASVRGKRLKSSSTKTKTVTTERKKTKSTQARKSNSKGSRTSLEPIHWILPLDPFDLRVGDAVSTVAPCGTVTPLKATGLTVPSLKAAPPFTGSRPEFLHFTIRGNPLPLRRHRTNKGFVYNPSAKAQESFRLLVKELLTNYTTIGASDNGTSGLPLFGSDQPLAMTIVFRTKRPNVDFVGGRPGAGRLHPTEGGKRIAPSPLWPPTRTDVDNLAKFVLDSLNGLLYEDDRQVVSLHVTKLRDDEDECRGSTEVCLRSIEEVDVKRLLDKAFDLF